MGLIMKYRMPLPGDTVFCWDNSNVDKYLPHKFMLYLGRDKNTSDNLLVHHNKYGWNIMPMSELVHGKFRSLGPINIIESLIEDDKIVGYVYKFTDQEPVLITVKLINGIWKIKKNFKTPSWVKR
jgi:hypothetical protein